HWPRSIRHRCRNTLYQGVERPVSKQDAQARLHRGNERGNRTTRRRTTMIGLDTNVVVRYLTFDDTTQTARAIALIDSLSPEAPGFVSVVVIIELVWVLESSYHFPKADILRALDSLLRSKELVIENAEAVGQAARTFAANRTEFADCLIQRRGY